MIEDLEYQLQEGTLSRSRQLLLSIRDKGPSTHLVNDYFANLEHLMQARKPLEERGLIVLGIGTGRCGSTTLSALMKTIPTACATHEVPPLVYWQPRPEQIDFHLRRLKYLSRYFRIVFDAAHWWINILDRVRLQFPELRLIALRRDIETCARSFLGIRSNSSKIINNWAPLGSDQFQDDPWNVTYPKYSLQGFDSWAPKDIKYIFVKRYIKEYNDRIDELADLYNNRCLRVRTEELGSEEEQKRIFYFVGLTGNFVGRKYNLDTIEDGASETFLV